MAVAPGDHHLARHARLRDHLRAASLDALLVTSLPNIAYLTGLFASTAVLMVTGDEVRLFVDGRYLEPANARREAVPGIETTLVSAASTFEDCAADAILALGAGQVGIEGSHLTVRQHDHLQARLKKGEWTGALQATDGMVENLRTVKDGWETARLRDAGVRLSDAAKCIIPKALAGMRERDVAALIEAELRRVGFDKPAFDTIVPPGRTRPFRITGAETGGWQPGTWWSWILAACSTAMPWTCRGPW